MVLIYVIISFLVVADVTSRVIFYQEFSLRRLLFPGSLQEFSSSFATLYSVLELRIRKIFLTVLNIFYSFCNLDSS